MESTDSEEEYKIKTKWKVYFEDHSLARYVGWKQLEIRIATHERVVDFYPC